jgi:hypothetical protein
MFQYVPFNDFQYWSFFIIFNAIEGRTLPYTNIFNLIIDEKIGFERDRQVCMLISYDSVHFFFNRKLKL